MSLDKEYIVDKRTYTIDTVPGVVIPENEFEYSALIKKVLSTILKHNNIAVNGCVIRHPPSALVNELVDTGDVGGVTIKLLEPLHPADVVITDIEFTWIGSGDIHIKYVVA